MKPAYGACGWMAIGAVVAVVEIFAPPDQLLSEQMDRWRAHPLGKYLATAGIVITASHLLRLTSPTVDPWTLAFEWKTRSNCNRCSN